MSDGSKFRRGVFVAACRSGEEQYHGYLYGPFAIDPRYVDEDGEVDYTSKRRAWIITHVPSGMRFGRVVFAARFAAEAFVMRLIEREGEEFWQRGVRGVAPPKTWLKRAARAVTAAASYPGEKNPTYQDYGTERG